MYELASTLGQPLSVILDMTEEEFLHWFTYYRVKDKRSKDGNNKRKRNI
jgi:hypothetical protein